MIVDASRIRDEAHSKALGLLYSLELPAGCALAATGSFARREMTPSSDLDLVLLHPDGLQLDEEAVASLWYPVWDAKYHLDYTVRTPGECAAVAASNAESGFAQLDFAYISGRKLLVDEARAKIYAAWRRQLSVGFDSFIDTAIARWQRAGAVATMTNPEIKNGRGGLRDIQLIRALALGNLCDMPDLDAERALLLDVRTLLHVHARRHRDVLDPEFAADVAQDLGFSDRYELSSALVAAAAHVDKAVERGLAVARGVIGKRGAAGGQGRAPRRPLDVDVIDAGGYVTLSRTPDLSDPALMLRVAAASARTGRPVAESTWCRLAQSPPLPQRWTAAAVDDFFAVLSSPVHTPRVIGELDAHGLWERLVPEWGHIRGRLPRERTHAYSIDYHTIATVARCAQERTTVARPDLLLLAALYHDIGKGYGRPHQQVGAQMVARMGTRLRLNLADRSRAQTLVAEHTTLAELAATMDPHSDAARDALLDAAQYDQLTVALLAVLARADAESTGPGVWTTRLALAQQTMTRRALEALAPSEPVRPIVHAPGELGLRVNWEESLITVYWSGNTQREVFRVLSLIGALGWTIVSSRMVRRENGGYAAEFDARTVQERFADAANEERFIQSYKSGTYTSLPTIFPEPTTALFSTGGVFEARTVERIGALGHLIAALPDVEWLDHRALGATLIVRTRLRGQYARATVVRNVTHALAGD